MRACNSQGACRKSENIFEVIYRQCPRPLAVLKSGRFFGGYARPHNGPLVTLGEAREGRRGAGEGGVRLGKSTIANTIPKMVYCWRDLLQSDI